MGQQYLVGIILNPHTSMHRINGSVTASTNLVYVFIFSCVFFVLYPGFMRAANISGSFQRRLGSISIFETFSVRALEPDSHDWVRIRILDYRASHFFVRKNLPLSCASLRNISKTP